MQALPTGVRHHLERHAAGDPFFTLMGAIWKRCGLAETCWTASGSFSARCAAAGYAGDRGRRDFAPSPHRRRLGDRDGLISLP